MGQLNPELSFSWKWECGEAWDAHMDLDGAMTLLCPDHELFGEQKSNSIKYRPSLNTGKKEDEMELILGCIQKKREDQELLYKKYYGYVMAIGLIYGSNREMAQEIVDDVFMKVFDAIRSFELNQSFKGWLRRITINTAIDHLRRDKRFSNHLDLSEHGHGTPSLDVVDTLVVEDIHRLIAALPDALKMVFNLYEVEGYSHREIADMLDISESSSRTYLARAKERLRGLVTKHFS